MPFIHPNCFTLTDRTLIHIRLLFFTFIFCSIRFKLKTEALLTARDIRIRQKTICGVDATLGTLLSGKRALERPDTLAVLAAHFVETFVDVPGLKAVFAEKAFHRHDATYILGTKATQTFLA